MKFCLNSIVFYCSSLLLFGAVQGAEILPPHGFDGGDDSGWTAAIPTAQPVIQDSGGPNGDGDSFLLLTARGGNGPSSRLSVFNDSPAWTGDYEAAGISGISVDLMNPATSTAVLLRAVLFGPGSTGNRWTSTEPISVANDGSWNNYFFPIDEASFTRVQGRSTFDEVISGNIRVMLRHDSGTPSGTGTAIRAQLGIDNIGFIGLLVGDYNGNGLLDAGDLDLQAEAISNGDTAFDLDNNGVTDINDRLMWIHDLQNSWVGDSNFDGEFNSTDFVRVFQEGKYETGQPATYVEGDWNGNGLFDSGDFVQAFQDGGYEQGVRPQAVAVPEPSFCGASLFLVFACFRPRKS
ncbi:MAG: hypothetical protein KDB27_08205 [Planctomycetales bacterium]|nr:hypothetical protein [Planctomycetales bacterium]